MVKEWYKEGIGAKLEYLDYMENIVSLISTPSLIYITNSGNKASLITDNTYSFGNMLSLATYIDIFNKEPICSCTKSVYDKNGEIACIYSFCNKDNCMQNERLKYMGITSIEMNIKDNKVVTATVYTENKKEYICIVYNKFETNILIEDNVFNINK